MSNQYGTQVTNWKDNFDARQQKAIKAATDISNKYADAGIPGHSLFIIIAKQTEILDQYERMISVMANLAFPLKLDVQHNYDGEVEVAKKLYEQERITTDMFYAKQNS